MQPEAEVEEDDVAELAAINDRERDMVEGEKERTGEAMVRSIQRHLYPRLERARPYPPCGIEDIERRPGALERWLREHRFDMEPEELEEYLHYYGRGPPMPPALTPRAPSDPVAMEVQAPAVSPKRKVDDDADIAMDTGEQPSSKEPKREDDGILQEILVLLKKYFHKDLPGTMEEDLVKISSDKKKDILREMLQREDELRKFSRSRRRLYYHNTYRPRDVKDSDEDSETDSGVPLGRLHEQQAKFAVPDEVRLRRVLILGSATCARLGTAEAVDESELSVVQEMVQADRGQEVVNILKDLCDRGATNRQNGVLHALALCIRCDKPETKKLAYNAVQDICRIPTHLFKLVDIIEALGKRRDPVSTGWGRGLRRVVSDWYNKRADNPMQLAMQVTKYGSRHEWSHRDLFRLSHIKPKNDEVGFIIRYLVKGLKEAETFYLEDGYLSRHQLEKVHKYMMAVEEAKKCEDEKTTIKLIQEHRLVREHLRTEMLNSAEVWRVMLPEMPLTATLRNLAKMTTLGLFDDSSLVNTVREKLLNAEALKKAKVHPLRILIAQRTYAKGEGFKGHLRWQPNTEIVTILDQAFYKSFTAVEPTGKRFFIALDISGSMGFTVMESQITCKEAATCLAMVMVKTEEHCELVGFHSKLIPLPQFKEEDKTLNKLMEETYSLGFGSTDCSKPMSHARKKKKDVDVFVVLTDSETNYHRIPPWRALQKYREAMNKPTAKLVVVGMTANNISIARPDDVHMLDIVGFDPDMMEVIREFVTGGLE